MSGHRYFIKNGIEFVQVSEYLSRELKNAGYAYSEIIKTPVGHRVVIYGTRPGMIIGKSGRNIKRLTDDLDQRFGLESPRLEVHEIENPDLNANIMLNRLLSQIERGFHYRRAAFSLMRRVMLAGARGCEIRIGGKLSSQRARAEAFREGFIAKTGEVSRKFVDRAVGDVLLKQGLIGVQMMIMQPDADLPDEPIFYDNPFGSELTVETDDGIPPAVAAPKVKDETSEAVKDEVSEVVKESENVTTETPPSEGSPTSDKADKDTKAAGTAEPSKTSETTEDADLEKVSDDDEL